MGGRNDGRDLAASALVTQSNAYVCSVRL